MSAMTHIEIRGREYFDRHGNTYHRALARVTRADGSVESYASREMTGAHGQYLRTAMKVLAVEGVIPEDCARKAPHRYCSENGIAYASECVKVTSHKALKFDEPED